MIRRMKERTMKQLLWVCLGSAIGGGARYTLSGWLLTTLGLSFPVGTLGVNLIGSFLIGGIMYAGVEASAIPQTARITLVAGFLGGFTTYSAFAYETLERLQGEVWGSAALYVVLTVFGCLLACLLGWWGARLALGLISAW